MSLKDRGVNQGHLQPVVVVPLDGQDALPISSTINNEITSLIQARYGDVATQVDDIRMDAATFSLQTIDYVHKEVHSGSKYFIEGHVTLDDAGVFYAKLVAPNTAKWSHFTWVIKSSGILDAKFYEIPTGGMAGGSRSVIHANNRNKNCWSGRQDGGDDQVTLTDSTQAWTVDALIGMQVFNQTDGSSAFITANSANTVTGVLAGGTGNDWDDGDVYEINNSQMVITGGVTVATSLGLLLNDSAVGGASFKGNVGGTADRNDEIVLKQNKTYLRSFVSGSDGNVISFQADWYEHTDRS